MVAPLNRRPFLKWATISALLGGQATPETSWAKAREHYGGSLRVSLPLSLEQLDPHEPTSLSLGLWGRALFETLYARTATGRPYPTLAASMPVESKDYFTVELRGDLRFSNGQKIEARECALALRRSQSLSSALRALGPPEWSRHQAQIVRFAKKKTSFGSATQVAAALANPRGAIVPVNFTPSSPIACGALKLTQKESRRVTLSRNPLAPRGGAFIDSLTLTSSSIADCLRAFESGRSDVGFLGSGLHQSRQDVTSFNLPPLGLVTLQAGSKNQQFQRPGMLHGALSHLPRAPFEALATHRVRSTHLPWRSGPVAILVNRDEPWLHAIAQELAQAWSPARTPSRVEALSGKQFEQRSLSQDYDFLLSALCTSEQAQNQASADLIALASKLPPRSGQMPSPEAACRRLHLGLVGELRPRGSLSSQAQTLKENPGYLDFANLSLPRPTPKT